MKKQTPSKCSSIAISRYMKILLLACPVVSSVESFAASVSGATVSYVSCVSSVGFCQLVIDKPLVSSTCPNSTNPVWKINHPYNKEYNALALAALVSGKTVNIVTTSECVSGSPVIDEIGLNK